MKILKTNGLKCDGYGFVTGLEDAGLQKDQGDDVRSGDLYMTIVQVDSRSMRLCKCSYRSIQDSNTLSTNICFFLTELL